MNNNDKPIGIFDSGLGGISVLKTCLNVLPNEKYIFYGDSSNAPYGTKTTEEVTDLCKIICDFFVSKDVKTIVIACNTATSAAVKTLRSRYDFPIIGMEPALKVAANNKQNNTIVIMATELTLREKKFKSLMDHYAGNNKIIRMPCPELVEIVESGNLDVGDIAKNQIKEYYKEINIDELDSIVLGCTHFVFYRNLIQDMFPNVNIIDGNDGTANHLKQVLTDRNMLGNTREITILNSNKEKIDLSKYLLNR